MSCPRAPSPPSSRLRRLRGRSRQRRRDRRRHRDQQGRFQPLDEHRREVERPAQRRGAGPDPPTSPSASRKAQVRARAGEGPAEATTDEQLKTQCKQEYDALRDQVMQLLISFQWIAGEAEEQGIKVTDAEVKKSFDEQKKQSFPKDADFQKFLKTSARRRPTSSSASSSTRSRTRSATRSSRARTRSPTPRSSDFYNKNKDALRPARAARPAHRPDQDQGQGQRGQGRAGERRVLEDGRQEVLDRRGVEGPGRQAARAGEGHAGEGARRRASSAPRRATSSARSRLSSATTSSRSTRSRRPRSSRSSRRRRRSSRRCVAEPAEGARQVRQGLPEEWKDKTDCRDGFVTQDCKNAPKAEDDPDGPRRRRRHAGTAARRRRRTRCRSDRR